MSGGRPYEFSDAEVAAVEQQVAAFRAITPRRLLVSLIRWLGPPLLIVAIVFLLLWIARAAPLSASYVRLKTRSAEVGIVCAVAAPAAPCPSAAANPRGR